MKPYERILLKAVLFTGLIQISTSLKCINCLSETLCKEEIECKAGQVCYMSRLYRFYLNSYFYDAGCGWRETQCQDNYFLMRRKETECCDTGDLCNAHITFSSDKHSTTTDKHSTTTDKHSTTTATPSFQLSKGIECHVCSGPSCGVTEDETMMKCPDTFPNCMNIVLNDDTGSKFVTKRCAKRSECQRKQDSVCVNFDPSAIYPKSLECIYCCETNGCNKDIVPKANTLLLG